MIFLSQLKGKNVDLVILLILVVGIYLLLGMDQAALFSLGFIWNWVGSHNLEPYFEHRRYRFSTLKTVHNLQSLILKPFPKAPLLIKMLLKSLPAGLFWGCVILFFDSELPLILVFAGSLTLELIHFLFKIKDSSP